MPICRSGTGHRFGYFLKRLGKPPNQMHPLYEVEQPARDFWGSNDRKTHSFWLSSVHCPPAQARDRGKSHAGPLAKGCPSQSIAFSGANTGGRLPDMRELVIMSVMTNQRKGGNPGWHSGRTCPDCRKATVRTTIGGKRIDEILN